MSQPVFHQFLTGATTGDAISGQAMIIRRWLRDLGFESQIYAHFVHPTVEEEVYPLSEYARVPDEKWAIYHHSIGSDVPDFLIEENLRLLLIYHNITPAAFFAGSDPVRMDLSVLGQQQLLNLREYSGLGLADSPFNEQDLEAAGYLQTAVLPITLCPEQYDIPSNVTLANQLRKSGPNLLFVGRLAPNKKQEDLIKLLYVYRRFNPDAHLYLVGDRWEIGYDNWVEDLAVDLKAAGGLTLTGKVSQQDLVTYYRCADFYVSMSEHEGFGIPLAESMYLGVPVLAYGVEGILETMGDAGILFFEKDYEGLAELLNLLWEDETLRRRIVTRQKKHAHKFQEAQVRRQFEVYLQRIGVLG